MMMLMAKMVERAKEYIRKVMLSKLCLRVVFSALFKEVILIFTER